MDGFFRILKKGCIRINIHTTVKVYLTKITDFNFQVPAGQGWGLTHAVGRQLSQISLFHRINQGLYPNIYSRFLDTKVT